MTAKDIRYGKSPIEKQLGYCPIAEIFHQACPNYLDCLIEIAFAARPFATLKKT
jgi:hypothetical protein